MATANAPRVDIGERNDPGPVPEANRDALGHASLLAGHLLVLASGTGGHRGGRVEGNLAVSTVLTHFRTSSEDDLGTRLLDALHRAHEVLASRAARDPSLHGSGAACAALLLVGGEAHAARCGDVQVLVVRGDETRAWLVDPDDVEAALGQGSAPRVVAGSEPLRLLPGDRLVVAGPGLTATLDVGEIGRIAASYVPQVAAGRLVQAARDRGARGGLGVQVVHFAPDARPMEVPPPLEVPPVRVVGPAVAPQVVDAAAREVEAPVAEASVITGEFPPLAAFESVAAAPAAGESDDSAADVAPRGRPASWWDSLGQRVPPRVVVGVTVVLAALAVWMGLRRGAEPEQAAPPAAADRGVVAPDDVEQGAEAPAARIAPPAALLPEPQLPGEPRRPAPVDRSEAPAVPARVPGGFWAAVDEAVRSGEPVTARLVRAWLEDEGDLAGPLPDRARARLAELRAVESALAHVLAPPDSLDARDRKVLDRIFHRPPQAAAPALKTFIEEQFDRRGKVVFDILDAYLQTHRSPDLAAVLLELSALRTGPRTRAWLRNRVPELLAGP